MQSKQNKRLVKLTDVKAYTPCPRSTFFLLHDPSVNSYRILFFDANGDFTQSPTEAIVHAAVISDFTPYFIYLDDGSCDKAIGAVSNLIIDSVQLCIHPKSRMCSTVPTALKRAYKKTVHALRTLADGCFLTDLFLRKLWELAYRTWRHVQAYYRSLRVRNYRTELATELVC